MNHYSDMYTEQCIVYCRWSITTSKMKCDISIKSYIFLLMMLCCCRPVCRNTSRYKVESIPSKTAASLSISFCYKWFNEEALYILLCLTRVWYFHCVSGNLNRDNKNEKNLQLCCPQEKWLQSVASTHSFDCLWHSGCCMLDNSL